MAYEEDRLLEGHNYDGIEEFDNPLPGWWLVTFFGTIIFSFIYYLHYEVGSGPNQAQQLAEDLAIIQSLKKGGPALDEEKLAAMVSQEQLDKGAQAFAAKCAACHGAKGEGLIGPNLTDKHFLHGNKRMDMYAVISNGVLDKGMPPWKDQMSSDELAAVTNYVFSLKGTFVAGKPPQGQELND